MNPVILQLKRLLQNVFASFDLTLDASDIVIETTKDPKFGDYATNVCLRFGKTLGQKPSDLATAIAHKINDPFIEKIEVAGPGFLNFFMKQDALTSVLSTIFSDPLHYGRSTVFQGQTINIEFVSANPTGPMHVAHARGAALGDAIATLLHHVGYTVTKEFYINDALSLIHI